MAHVLFVCLHNAGRSQMSQAFFAQAAPGHEGRSAGTDPADAVHPEVVEGQSGQCPICRMALVPVRLDLVWSCQLHLDRITERDPGVEDLRACAARRWHIERGDAVVRIPRPMLRRPAQSRA